MRGERITQSSAKEGNRRQENCLRKVVVDNNISVGRLLGESGRRPGNSRWGSKSNFVSYPINDITNLVPRDMWNGNGRINSWLIDTMLRILDMNPSYSRAEEGSKKGGYTLLSNICSLVDQRHKRRGGDSLRECLGRLNFDLQRGL